MSNLPYADYGREYWDLYIKNEILVDMIQQLSNAGCKIISMVKEVEVKFF